MVIRRVFIKKIKEIFSKLTTSFLGFAIFLIVLFIVIPFPVIILDIFTGLNILFAVLILLIVLNTKRMTDFSLFPTALLVSTAFTPVINISIIKTILSNGSEYNGRIIRFISYLIAGTGETASLWSGFILLIIILLLMIIIVTKGGTRLTKVAARFKLDSMQVKMMAIEVEYSADEITEGQAQLRKQEIQKESNFYCSLNAVMKFISGNTKFALFFIIYIILGGIIIDYLLHEAVFLEALKFYLYISIGSGVVFFLPIFIISLAVSISVTRSALPIIETKNTNGTFDGKWKCNDFELRIKSGTYISFLNGYRYGKGKIELEDNCFTLTSTHAKGIFFWQIFVETVRGKYFISDNKISISNIEGRYEKYNGTWEKL
ncbi:MAG: FHIPEP family type III secretion protein [Treponema sp.]|jgi:flagellar biosynthesis component FlhA|nr:FHIPEP family type III secretion protein [Treponema sp.]